MKSSTSKIRNGNYRPLKDLAEATGFKLKNLRKPAPIHDSQRERLTKTNNMALDPQSDQVKASDSKKKLIIIIAAALVLAGGGATWFSMHQKSARQKEDVKLEGQYFECWKHLPGIYYQIPMRNFLQLDLSVQIDSPEIAEQMKIQMPAVRNRLLMLLTSKKATEIFHDGWQKAIE